MLAITMAALSLAGCRSPVHSGSVETIDVFGTPLVLQNYREVDQLGYFLQVGTDRRTYKSNESPVVTVRLTLPGRRVESPANYRVRMTLVYAGGDTNRSEKTGAESALQYFPEAQAYWFHESIEKRADSYRFGRYVLTLEIESVEGLRVDDISLVFTN